MPDETSSDIVAPTGTVAPVAFVPAKRLQELGDQIVAEFRLSFTQATLTPQQAELVARAAAAYAEASVTAIAPPSQEALDKAIRNRQLAVATLNNVFVAKSLGVSNILHDATVNVLLRAITFGLTAAITS